jgi:hypothetical protein
MEAVPVVAGLGDAGLEASLPFGQSSLELFWPGWPPVARVDAVGGPPDGDFTNEGGTQRTAWRCPPWLGGVAEGVVSDVLGTGGNQLGSFHQVVTPIGVILDHLGDSAEPRQWWSSLAGCWIGKAPVQDSGHISSGAEITPDGRLMEVDQGMFAGRCGQDDQVATQGRSGRLVSDAGHDLFGSAVEHIHESGSDDLFGGDV